MPYEIDIFWIPIFLKTNCQRHVMEEMKNENEQPHSMCDFVGESLPGRVFKYEPSDTDQLIRPSHTRHQLGSRD